SCLPGDPNLRPYRGIDHIGGQPYRREDGEPVTRGSRSTVTPSPDRRTASGPWSTGFADTYRLDAPERTGSHSVRHRVYSPRGQAAPALAPGLIRSSDGFLGSPPRLEPIQPPSGAPTSPRGRAAGDFPW